MITQDLIQKSKGLLEIQPEINDWTGRKYHMFNTGSVEVETAEFLYGLVRVTKPKRILDTGTHFGVSALYMAQAMQDNDLDGQVISLELEERYAQKAKELWVNCGLGSRITSVLGKSLDYRPEGEYDLMLLDTEPDLRFKELMYFYPFLKPGSFLFIHDLHRHMSQEDNKEHGFGFPFGPLPQQIKDMVKADELRPFHFPTPRGLFGAYKPAVQDFSWQ